MFWQIHRGTLVNVNAIAGVTRNLGGQLCVKVKQRKEVLPVSDSYVHLFKQM
jgi:DNA-binding LytR/AlgR family response regulator